jgi:hypothetical protein
VIGLTLEEAHQLEDELERELKRQNPKHPALKFYGSTYKAIDAYYEALYGHKFFEEAKHQ